MALVRRLLEISFQLSQPQGQAARSFKEGGNTVTLSSGLRASARMVKAGGPSMGSADIRVYGMSMSLMNQLSTLGLRVVQVPRDIVTVKAGDEGSVLSTVYVGNVQNAYADFGGAPDVPFIISGQVALASAAISATPTSFKGTANAADIMSGLAARAGLQFSNDGVKVQLSNQYLAGTLREQMLKVVENANIEWNACENGIVAIWPKNGARGGLIPLISPDTGMIGYPTYTAEGIMLRTIFNPSVGLGGKIKVQSSLEPASRTWAVFGLSHELETLTPGGKWESTILAFNSDYKAPVPIAP